MQTMATKKKSRGRARNTRHRGIGLLFWICLAAIIVAVGVAARPSLEAAFKRFKGEPTPTPSTQGPASAPATHAPAPQVTITALPPDTHAPDSSSPSGGASALNTPSPNAPAANAPASGSPSQRQPSGKAAPAAQSQTPATRKARLFFINVDQNGALSMKGVIRSIPASDSPLRDAVQTLLKGPTAQELTIGLLSMVPTETKLRGVTMHGDTAYIDFDESFRFNTQGVEALQAQLRQVVYSATEFPTVKSVQILIEGKIVRYLGTEGVRVDEPLSRASFTQ
jgi:germination protein M